MFAPPCFCDVYTGHFLANPGSVFAELENCLESQFGEFVHFFQTYSANAGTTLYTVDLQLVQRTR